MPPARAASFDDRPRPSERFHAHKTWESDKRSHACAAPASPDYPREGACPRYAVAMRDNERRCETCRSLLARTSRPDRPFCSPACRQSAYERRQAPSWRASALFLERQGLRPERCRAAHQASGSPSRHPTIVDARQEFAKRMLGRGRGLRSTPPHRKMCSRSRSGLNVFRTGSPGGRCR